MSPTLLSRDVSTPETGLGDVTGRVGPTVTPTQVPECLGLTDGPVPPTVALDGHPRVEGPGDIAWGQPSVPHVHPHLFGDVLSAPSRGQDYSLSSPFHPRRCEELLNIRLL